MIISNLFKTTLLALFLVAFMFSCTERAVDSDQYAIKIQMDPGFGTGELGEMLNLICLTVSARDMEPVTVCLPYVGGPLTFEIDVPAGRDRLFVLQGINQSVEGQIVLYQGSAIADVEADVAVELNIHVEPVVPLIRLVSFQTVVRSGESFHVDVQAFNLPALRQIDLRLPFDLTLLGVDSVTKGATLALNDYIEWGGGSVDPWLTMQIADPDSAGAIVDSTGYSHLASVWFTSGVTVDSVNTALECLPLVIETNDESVIVPAEIYSQLATVVIRPYQQPVMRLTPSTVDLLSGQEFFLDVELFNFPGLDSAFFLLGTDVMYIEVDSFTKGLTLDDSDDFEVMQIGGDFQIPAPSVGDTTGGTIVDSDGYCHIARAYLTTLVTGTDIVTDVFGSAGWFYLVGSDSVVVDEVIYQNTSVSIGAFQDRVVTFVDPMLEAGVRSYINQPEGDILLSDVFPLEYFSSTFQEIDGLGGIEEMVNLISLNLSHNLIDDFAPLSSLTTLRYLSLNTNSITDISPLSSLVDLTHLDLSNDPDYSGNYITNLTPLGSLSRLQELDISRNFSNPNLAPLANLTNVKELYLASNNIVDISALQYMTGLDIVDLDFNSIVDITALVNNSGITGATDTVYLGSNPLSAQASESDIPALQARGVTVIIPF